MSVKPAFTPQPATSRGVISPSLTSPPLILNDRRITSLPPSTTLHTKHWTMPPTKRPAIVTSAASGIKRKRTAGGAIKVTAKNGGGTARAAGTAATAGASAASSPLYDEFIQLLSNPQYKGRGIANSALKDHFGAKYPDLVPIINELTRASRLTMSKGTSKTGESEVFFSLLSAEEATKLQGLDAPSKMVYQVIEASGNRGIWTVDVRVQTNIQQATLTKIFKVRVPGTSHMHWCQSTFFLMR